EIIDARTCLRSEKAVIYSPRFEFSAFLFWNFGEASRGRLWKPLRRSRTMGLVLLVVIWLITLVSTYFFVAKTWWLPAGASAAAAGIDHHFTVSFYLMGFVFVAAQLVLGYLVWKYRSEEHTSELQSRFDLVCRLLLEKKKNNIDHIKS